MRFEEIAREILQEAKAIDEAEDELYGDERGDELPEQLRTREGRAEFFRRARERRAAESRKEQQLESEPAAEAPELEFGPSGSSPAAKDAKDGRAKRTASSSGAAGSRQILFPVRARLGCCSPHIGWRQSVTVRSRPTGHMRTIGRRVVTPKAGGSVATEANGSRRRCPTV
jgi:hypothetical protein